MGLMAAYRASKDGHDVHLLEAASEAGGMAEHFNFYGISLERFYHFICRTDQSIFEAMKELGIEDTLRWRDTTVGFFDGRLHRWGDSVSLLRSVSPHFWINISEANGEIPVLNQCSFDGDSIVYVPYYMPTTNEKFS
jgi:protoporphyrinogen oxidase